MPIQTPEVARLEARIQALEVALGIVVDILGPHSPSDVPSAAAAMNTAFRAALQALQGGQDG